MFKVLQNTWALFFGFALISLGHGLQGTLIGVRSVLEGFSFFASWLIIAGYYVGYLTGALTIPIFLQRVGHIRVFAALASLASIAILLHSVFVHPYSWMFIRILTGLSLAGIYVIMESWLNEKSTNQTRGQLLSVYMIITFVFVGAGQFLLNLGDPAKVDLFILVSILLFSTLLLTSFFISFVAFLRDLIPLPSPLATSGILSAPNTITTINKINKISVLLINIEYNFI